MVVDATQSKPGFPAVCAGTCPLLGGSFAADSPRYHFGGRVLTDGGGAANFPASSSSPRSRHPYPWSTRQALEATAAARRHHNLACGATSPMQLSPQKGAHDQRGDAAGHALAHVTYALIRASRDTGGLSPFRQAKAPQSRRVRPRRCVLERRSRPWGEREAPGTKERPSVPKISLNFCLYKGCSPSLQPLELASCEQGVGRNPLAAPSRHPRAPPTGEWASRGALSRTPRTPAPRMLAAAPRDGASCPSVPARGRQMCYTGAGAAVGNWGAWVRRGKDTGFNVVSVGRRPCVRSPIMAARAEALLGKRRGSGYQFVSPPANRGHQRDRARGG